MALLSDAERRKLNHDYHIEPQLGKNPILDRSMITLRQKIQTLPRNLHYTLFYNGDLTQLWLQTPPCRYNCQGKCTVCNYWKGTRIPEVVDELIHSGPLPCRGDTILLNTCGSCLDSYELSIPEQESLLRFLSCQSPQSVILETHLFTLTEETLSRVCPIFRNKNLFFEVGIESTCHDVLTYCLNKPTSMVDLLPYLRLIHKFNAKLIANVLLGAPFLSSAQQIEDAIQSICDLLSLGVDCITLFPVNIKPATLASFLYRHKLYEPVSSYMIAQVLINLPQSYLKHIELAWYGEHTENGVIIPLVDDTCRAIINQFNQETNCTRRRNLVDLLLVKSTPRKFQSSSSLFTTLDQTYSYLRNL